MSGLTFSGYQSAVVITPSDTAIVNARGLAIGQAGTLTVVPAAGTVSVTFSAQAGQVLPLAVKQVLATGTTATNIVGLT